MNAVHFISLVCNEEITRLGNGECTMEEFLKVVDALERQSYLPTHSRFFAAVRDLAKKVVDTVH